MKQVKLVFTFFATKNIVSFSTQNVTRQSPEYAGAALYAEFTPDHFKTLKACFTTMSHLCNQCNPILLTLLFSTEGMFGVLQSNERMWTVVRSDSMTYWNDGLIEPDFRPVEGELSPAHESHFLSCWELEKRHKDQPQSEAEWIHRAFFSGGGWDWLWML